MKKLLSILMLIVSVANNTYSQYIPDGIKSLIDREAEFDYDIASDGIAEGFLSVMYKNCTVFVPDPQEGNKYFKARKKLASYKNGQLSMEPIYADISNDQKFGYTTGSFHYMNNNNPETYSHGNYVSIWIKPKDKWVLLVHGGIATPKTNDPAFSYADPITFGMKASAFEFIAEDKQQSSMAMLKSTDELFCVALSKGITPDAYSKYMYGDVRFIRKGVEPIYNMQNAIKYAQENYIGINYYNTKTFVTLSLDLGYTMGNGNIVIKNQDGTQTSLNISYIRIWRKTHNGIWNITTDIEMPLPN